MPYIQLTDFESSIHTEILNAVVRNNNQTIDDCVGYAIEEVKSYLSGRYDVEDIFNKTGTSRQAYVLMITKDIALYHIHSTHNPQKFPEIRRVRYEEAIEWLKDVQKGKVNPMGLILKTFVPDSSGDTSEGGYLMSSNKKRINHL